MIGESSFTWACGAVGSALPWHGRGREFESHQVHQNKPQQNIDLRKWLCASTSRKRSRGVHLESKFAKIWTPASGFGCRGSKDGATCARLYLIFRDVREPLSSRAPSSTSIAHVAEECSWVNPRSSRRAGVSPVPSLQIKRESPDLIVDVMATHVTNFCR